MGPSTSGDRKKENYFIKKAKHPIANKLDPNTKTILFRVEVCINRSPILVVPI
jgi:hypothetical protein